MSDLKVTFEFTPNAVLGFTIDDVPIHGDRITITVGEHKYQESFTVDSFYVAIDLDKKRAELFGVALQRIGAAIAKQAVYGY